MNNPEKEVYFNQYCRTCKYKEFENFEDPCYDCLATPVNTDSHKPVFWKAKEKEG